MKSLEIAYENKCKSIAFPLISTGSFGYPKEEGMRIAVDEINAFLLKYDMLIYLVVFDTESTRLGLNLYPDLEAYIDHNYVCDKREKEYGDRYFGSVPKDAPGYDAYRQKREKIEKALRYPEIELLEECSVKQCEPLMTNAEVYKRAIITKQLFSKIKLNPDYHPDKATAMRLCVGARLNLDETKDLLARAG